MADTTTTTYSLTKPEVGASEDTWGTKTNTNWDSVDGILDGTTTVEGIKLDDNLSIVDSADGTKVVKFQASGIATATTRTFTFPDFDGTFSTLAGTETLTNKTLTSPTVDLSTVSSAGDLAVADGGTGASTAAAALTNLGALPLAGGTLTGPLSLTDTNPRIVLTDTDTGAVSRLNADNASGSLLIEIDVNSAETSPRGSVLIQNTIAAQFAPAGATIENTKTILTDEKAAGKYAEQVDVGLVPLATISLSTDTTAEFTAFDASLYDDYVFVFNYVIPSADGAMLTVRVSHDGGSTYENGASDYAWTTEHNASSLTSSAADTSGRVSATGVGSAANEYGFSGTLDCIAPSLSTYTQLLGTFMWISTAGVPTPGSTSSIRNAVTAVDGVQFLFDSGTLESGRITMYGRRKFT